MAHVQIFLTDRLTLTCPRRVPEAICGVRRTGSRVYCVEVQCHCHAALRYDATPSAALCPETDSRSAKGSLPEKCLQ